MFASMFFPDVINEANRSPRRATGASTNTSKPVAPKGSNHTHYSTPLLQNQMNLNPLKIILFLVIYVPYWLLFVLEFGTQECCA